jgi:hypothetical protein
MNGIANVETDLSLGSGAQFWAYISPQNKTAERLLGWKVELTQIGGNWKGSITSSNPQAQLQTPNLSGEFTVKVTASLKGVTPIELTLQPSPDSQRNVGCNSNCAAMIGIVASEDGKTATYWTVWDALCKRLPPAS